MVPPPDYYAILPPRAYTAERCRAAGKIAYVIWGVPFFPATIDSHDRARIFFLKLPPLGGNFKYLQVAGW